MKKVDIILRGMELSKKMNPYSEILFPEMSNQDLIDCANILKANGFSPDRFCGNLMRKAYVFALDQAQLAVADAFGFEGTNALKELQTLITKEPTPCSTNN